MNEFTRNNIDAGFKAVEEASQSYAALVVFDRAGKRQLIAELWTFHCDDYEWWP